MNRLSKNLKYKLILIFLSTLAINVAKAETNAYTIKKAKETEKEHKHHLKQLSKSQKYHGVFYGVLPCKDCDGTMVTLSLKTRNNYLRVTQPAKNSAREYFEKGKYSWDDETKIVTLKPRKKTETRQYKINADNTLTELSSTGVPLKATQKNTSYVLHQKEMEEKKPLMHIH